MTLAAVPLSDAPPPALVRRWIEFCCRDGAEYFPLRVVVEDEAALKADQAYVIGARARFACVLFCASQRRASFVRV